LRPCREFKSAIRESRNLEIFALIRESRSRPLFWHLSPLATNPIVPTDLERCRESEQGRRQMFEVEADLGVRGRLWPHVKTSPRHAAKRSLSSSTQTIELAIDGRRGFTSSFPPPAKVTPDSETLPLPGTLTFRYCSYGSMTYSNQFCLNERKKLYLPNENLTFV